MFKKVSVILCFLLLTSAVVFAQTATEAEPEKEKPRLGFNFGFNIGLSSYENIYGRHEAFQKFSFFPEFTYGNWGLCLDITFEFDGDFKQPDLNDDGKADRWDDFTDYLYKIYYVRYGHKGDPLYGRLGAFQGYTLGHGLIMEDYSNTLFHPQVIRLGLNLDIDGSVFNFPWIGMESVVDDVFDWDVIGVRIYSRPFMNLSTPIINELKVGATIVTDLDPRKPTEKPKDDPDIDSVTEFGFDVEAPLLERQDMSVIAYADWAQISGKGSGSFIGSIYTYKWFSLLGQLRFFGKQFVPHYFDPYYDLDRETKYDDPVDGLDAYKEFYMGYLIGTEMSILNILGFFFYWSDGFNDEPGPRIQTGVETTEDAIPKFSVSLMYDKKDIDDFGDFFDEEDSLAQFTVGYQVTKMTAIVFIWERTISLYTDEPTSRIYIETQFSF